jgi:hypothetical protein
MNSLCLGVIGHDWWIVTTIYLPKEFLVEDGSFRRLFLNLLKVY